MTIEQQKQVADEVLKHLETIDVNCMIVGGAPRDWFSSRECNDLDVFITGGMTDISEELELLFGFLDIQIKRKEASENHTGIDIKIYTFNFLDMKIQVVKPESYISVISMVQKVDFVSSKCFYKNRMIFLSEEFIRDYQ